MEQRRRLVKRAQKGDEEAFITLMQHYESTLYGGALQMLRHEADGDARDGASRLYETAYVA